jgi:hypothetical protein
MEKIPINGNIKFIEHDCIHPLQDVGEVHYIIHAEGIVSPAH